jgi:hypothetical protein
LHNAEINQVHGDILQWDHKARAKVSINEHFTVEEGSLVYRRLMCNYYSIGVESRIGLGFDKQRTGSKLCNDIAPGTYRPRGNA